MHKPEFPPNECARVETLHALELLDTEPEERFDRVTRLARRLFGVPIALVSLVDSDRQWFKSHLGLEARETPREISFCGHSILGTDVLVVSDAREDERFSDNPLVVQDPKIRFYAGCPLAAANGLPLGTLCLIDREPRSFSGEDHQLLKDLAAMVERELAAVELATLDELTGLSNRRGFENLARHVLATAARTGNAVTLLFIDLDEFKAINDGHGHAEGDRALVEMASLLLSVFRNSDLVGRLGGDEFGVLLFGASEADTGRSIAALDEAIRARNSAEGRAWQLRYSYGASTFSPSRHANIADMMREADERMYERKFDRRAARS